MQYRSLWFGILMAGWLLAGGRAAAADLALPEPLSAADVDRYATIFALQDQGAFDKADAILGKVTDPMLKGVVLAQRYLHPTAYRSTYKQLYRWLQAYADHPDATRIYRLARLRGPEQGLPRPQGTLARWSRDDDSPALTYRERRAVARVGRALRRGHTKTARLTLEDPYVARRLRPHVMGSLSGNLAFQYVLDGEGVLARHWADKAISLADPAPPMGLWAAGLEAWRRGALDQAFPAFAALAEHPDSSPWLVSAGAYWGARTGLRAGRMQDVAPLLLKAANHPQTFYGLLGRRALGLPLPFTWAEDTAPLRADALDALAVLAAGRRMFALLQVGAVDQAEQQARLLVADADDRVRDGLHLLAKHVSMPALALDLAPYEAAGDAAHPLAYPVPARWTPPAGWQVDKALVFALMRQESRFNPLARSHAGARGLMQLMPATASYISRDRSLRRERSQLYDPHLNLDLGQRYLAYLMQDEVVGGDLFRLAVAYNAGPGNLRRWLRRADQPYDPLLFIETLPARETRIYVEKVLANLWIYRSRMGQPQPSLDALVQGSWPTYVSLDQAAETQVATTKP